MNMRERIIRAGSNIKESNKDVGVEIEIEGSNLPTDFADSFWKVERDGSLRGEAFEYVSTPMNIDQLGQYMAYFKSKFIENHAIINDSIRAGVHVHMNIQKLTFTQFFNVVTAYFILEDLLVKWCGPSREGNLFCLRAKDAEWVLLQLFHVAQTGNIRSLHTEHIRYCSLNFLSMFKYGTLEFRAMRTSPQLELIETWTNMIWELKENALKFENPLEMITSISGDGVDSFLNTILPTYSNNIRFPGYQATIFDGIRRIQMVANGRNWNEKVEIKEAIDELPNAIDDWAIIDQPNIRIRPAQDRVGIRVGAAGGGGAGPQPAHRVIAPDEVQNFLNAVVRQGVQIVRNED